MPAMPQVLLRFFNAAGSDSTSTEVLASLVLQDPALSARILTAANAAAFRRGPELRSIKQCLAVLGTRMVRTIASCLLVQSAFQRVPDSDARELAGFWRHSLLVAELARGLAVELGSGDEEAEEAYLAGLLHDVGQLLLLGGLGDAYGAILARDPGEEDLSDRERAVLDTDHGAVGAWFVDQWELPSLMADAILFHHLAADKVAGLDRLGRLLWCAHAVCLAWLGSQRVPLQTVERLIGVDPGRLDALHEAAQLRVDSLALALDVAKASRHQTVPQRGTPRTPPADAPPADDRHDAALQAVTLPMTALHALPLDLSGVHRETDLLLCLQEAARILFGVRHLAFFLRQPPRHVLSAAGTGALAGALQRLEIPLDSPDSLCARAALSRDLTVATGLEGPEAAPTDRQVARALGADCVIYLPLLAGGSLAGVMALGVSQVQRTRLSGRSMLLENFASVAAANLAAWRQMREREAQVAAEVGGRYVLKGQRVAHEVNNPLAIIRNYLTLISNDAAAGAGAVQQADIDVLREEIERLSGIVTRLGSDADAPRAPSGAIDLNQVVESMRTLYEASLFGAAGVRLELDLPADPVFAGVASDAVKQIVFNLWKNAAQALAPGGVVRTAVHAHVNQNGTLHASIVIQDNGPGLPAAVLDSLYRPLPTAPGTPGADGRAGLGLSIVLGLVERLHGSISCLSRPGQGTTFTLLVPEPQRTPG